MENSKVSVIVPVYNVEKYLNECIESIIKQEHTNIEIILIDDGSTDSSGKICDEYKLKDQRIKVVHNDNKGVSNARNTGITFATGDYICFVDSDDYIMQDYVSYLLGLIINNKCDVSVTQSFNTSFSKNKKIEDNIRIITGREAKIEILKYKYPIGVYCKMFSRSFLIKNKILFDEELVIGEGFNFNTLAFQNASKVCVGQKNIYFYRRTNALSVTTNFNAKKWENGIWAIKKIKQNNIFNDKEMIYALNYAEWHTNRDVVDFILVAKKKKENISLYKKCRKICKKYWYIAFKLNINSKEKIRSLILLFFPKVIPFLIRKRLKKHKEETNEFN